MRKAEFLISRTGSALVVLLGVSVVTFVLARVIPTNLAAEYVGYHARPAQIARAAHQLGLDRSLPVQYLHYMNEILHGNLGISVSTKRPVLADIAQRLPNTLELLVLGMIIAVLAGIVLGALSARWRGRAVDGPLRSVSILGVSFPAFWLGLMLQIVFFRMLDWLPLAGQSTTDLSFTNPIHPVTHFQIIDAALTGNWIAFRDVAAHLVLPAVTLAAFPAGLIARMIRASMLEVLEHDYIRTARAYGLPDRLITFGYALKNAIGPTLAVIGLSFAYALTGSFFVEVIYDWPGLGQYTVNALLALDYPAIMGVTLLGAVSYIVINLAVDVAQAWLDPRVSLA
ncbi:MAG TPA: ABC transporter permease [Streptosporangiaceae bacterium]|nr:ABC transporter permease [Streptosporangiaceae bacterium]